MANFFIFSLGVLVGSVGAIGLLVYIIRSNDKFRPMPGRRKINS